MEPATPSRVLQAAFDRVAAAMPSLLIFAALWIALSVAMQIPVSEPADGAEFDFATATINLAALFALIVVSWKVTRSLASAEMHERGEVIPWIAWSLIAALPGIVPFAALALAGPEASSAWLDPLVTGLSMALLFPVWVYATGKAIDAQRIDLSATFAFWKKSWLALSVVLFVIAAIDAAAYAFILPPDVAEPGTADGAARALGAAVVNAIATITNLAILVSAWRMTPGSTPVARDETVS